MSWTGLPYSFEYRSRRCRPRVGISSRRSRNAGTSTFTTFRRDLFYRVNVVKVEVPALRDRREDIPTLGRHLLLRYSKEYGRPVHDIQPDAMELLVEYDWPGNVRELE